MTTLGQVTQSTRSMLLKAQQSAAGKVVRQWTTQEDYLYASQNNDMAQRRGHRIYSDCLLQVTAIKETG